MKLVKHCEQNHPILYLEEGNFHTCITLDNDEQLDRLCACFEKLKQEKLNRIEVN
jgi:hypothetical protein